MSLHPNSKARIRREMQAAVDEATVWWRHPITDERISEAVDVTVRHTDEPDSKQYPQVTFEFSPDGVPQQRVDLSGAERDHEVRFERPDSNEIAYERYVGTPMYSILNVTVTMNSSSGQIPKHVVANKVAHDLRSHLLFNTDHLNEQGTTADGEPVPYEWPLEVKSRRGDGLTPNHGMVDEQPVSRYHFQLRVEYFFWRDEEVEQTKAIEWLLELDSTGDGETNVTSGPHQVPGYFYGEQYGIEYGG